jgi:hypothetical protein
MLLARASAVIGGRGPRRWLAGLGFLAAFGLEPASAGEPLSVEAEPRGGPEAPAPVSAQGSSAGAIPVAPARPEPRVPSPLPELASIFPGLILHGSGAWLQHRNQTAGRLLMLEGASVLATFTSGLILFSTGAARDIVGPTALLAVAGVGTFAVSFLASVYATVAPPDGLGDPLRRQPLIDSSAGYLYVYDPQFAYRHFVTVRASAFVQDWHVLADVAAALDHENQRYSLGVGYRLLGSGGSGSEPASDGSYLEPRLAFTAHRFEPDGFNSRIFELAVEGRLDVSRYLPDVRGAFFQGEAGWASQVFVNHVPGPNPTTATSLLLAHVGFGMYLGNRVDSRTGGEAELYYDHRHDGYAGGLKVNGLGSGVAGHLGLRGSYQLTPRWGVRARAEAGSAYLLGLDLVVRGGVF